MRFADEDLADIAGALAAHGLIPRGHLTFEPGEDVPDGPGGDPATSALLVGHGGGSIWPHFSAWRRRQPDGLKDPLDSWSRAVIGAVARDFGARAVFPSNRPWLPFQQWAMRAEGLKPSPLGMLMHPQFGLWHAYRGALLFDAGIAFPAPQKVIHACDRCDGKPCLNACPADAVSQTAFDVGACRSLLARPAGSDCLSDGCLARTACPVGTEYRYGGEQMAFHMAALEKNP